MAASGSAMSFSAYKRWIKNMKPRMVTAGIRGLHSAAARGVQIIVTEIIPSRIPQPVDRGLYRAGWRFRLEFDGAWIENNEPTAEIIEGGVRAENIKIGRAMIQALTEWVVRKGLTDAEDAPRAAWAIAKSMQRKGIFGGGKGLRIFEEFYTRRLDPLIKGEIDREIRAEMAKGEGGTK